MKVDDYLIIAAVVLIGAAVYLALGLPATLTFAGTVCLVVAFLIQTRGKEH